MNAKQLNCSNKKISGYKPILFYTSTSNKRLEAQHTSALALPMKGFHSYSSRTQLPSILP